MGKQSALSTCSSRQNPHEKIVRVWDNPKAEKIFASFPIWDSRKRQHEDKLSVKQGSVEGGLEFCIQKIPCALLEEYKKTADGAGG